MYCSCQRTLVIPGLSLSFIDCRPIFSISSCIRTAPTAFLLGPKMCHDHTAAGIIKHLHKQFANSVHFTRPYPSQAGMRLYLVIKELFYDCTYMDLFETPISLFRNQPSIVKMVPMKLLAPSTNATSSQLILCSTRN